jgi:hypothetical protein
MFNRIKLGGIMSNELVDPKTMAQNFWSHLSAEDFSAPIVSIGQGTGNKGLPGHFIFNSGDQKPELKNCKLIHVKKGRVLYSSKSRSLCGSDDFYRPAARHENKMSVDCNSCQLKEWGANDIKESVKKRHGLDMVKDLEKPMCHETYNLLMADENCNPFFISFAKTQLKVVSEKLLSRLRMGFGSYAPFLVAYDMSLVKQQGNGVSYYSVAFNNFRPVEGKEAADVTALYQAWASKAAEVLARQYQESDLAHEEKEKIVGE